MIFALLVVVAPALLLWLCRHVAAARKAGPIVLCYAAGLLIGLAGILPDAAVSSGKTAGEAALALALPLLLFSVDLRAWGHVAGRAILSMLLAVASVTCVASLLFAAFSAHGVAQPEQLSAMAIGMYTGGIANLGAIKLALGIPDARYLLFATVDTAVGALYLLFVLTTAPRLFARFLPAFAAEKSGEIAEMNEETYADLVTRAMLPGVALALASAAACVGLALVTAPLLPFANVQVTVIVLLTTFGLVGSFWPALRTSDAAPRLGMYLIYVFTFAVAASLDLSSLAGLDLSVLVFVLVSTFGSLALHAAMCRAVKVDRDTFLITSVAAIMSPAFVPMAARALGNPGVLMSGMATGILGFALGNYLAITVALILASGG